ncbi:FHA domain-containing protein [Actinoallomurus sp. CA-150999]|uniref:FHA domain-containing protein n=1 Tax=Actinoallomurus sp. CA-150999 TaxID=3239887 RepID=UPI003D916443
MAPLTCPVCAAPVRQGDLICINCGANLARREAPPAPQQPGGYPPQDQGQGQSSYPQQQYPPQGDQQQQSYGAPQQQSYGGPQQDYQQQQQPYGAPQQQYPPQQDQQQSYGAPQDSPPYGAPQQQEQSPYGAPPQQQGYGAPQDQQRNAQYPPAQGQPQYGAPQQQDPSAYGAPPQQEQSYGAPQQQEQSPYGAPPQQDQQQGYGAPQQQYAPPQQQQGYGGGGYGAPGAPHVPPPPREPTMTGGESTAAFTPFCPHCGADIPDIGNPVCVSCLRPLHDQAGGPGQQQQLTVFVQFSSGELQCTAGQELVLGRDPVQSPVAGTFSRFDNVSRRHATIGIDGNGQAWVRDERSTNGTFINDRRLQPGEQAPIRDGDSVRLAADARGQVRFGR